MPESKEPLSLVSLEVENILRLKAFKMTMSPDGVVVIEAKNEQGKSSAVKSLEMALAGLSEAPPEPLHGDAKKGYIIATFDGLVVKRVFRSGKPPALTVTNEDGTRVKAPQTLLDTLVNRACLRPTKLMEASDKEQVAILSEIMGFDSKPYDAEIEAIFNCRTDANREAKRLAAVVTGTTFNEDAPDEEVSVSELMAELSKRRDHNATIAEAGAAVVEGSRVVEDADDALEHLSSLTQDLDSSIEALEAELAEKRKQRQHAETSTASGRKKLAETQARLAELTAAQDVIVPADEDEITTQIASADDINRQVRANVERAAAVKEAKAAQKDADGYDKALTEEKAKREKARMEARERLPVPGLDISEDCVLFNNKPLSQAGASAQLRVCIAVAIKGNKDKRVRILLIDNAEKLDADSTQMVMEMARDASYQVMLTKVIARTEDASEASVVIEDGTVKE